MTQHGRLIARDEREAKLPRWARDTLASLRVNLLREENRAEHMRDLTGAKESDVLVDFYDRSPIGLGKGTRVRFKTGEDDWHNYVDIHVAQGVLVLHGAAPLAFRACASNSFEVEVCK